MVSRGETLPLDGADTLYEPLHPDGGDEQLDGTIHCKDGWGHLMVVMEGEPKQVWSLLPFGQSEDPTSPHYDDQAKLHSERKLKRFWLTPEEVLANTESVWGDLERIKTMNNTWQVQLGVPSKLPLATVQDGVLSTPFK